MATDKESLIVRLLAACNGLPSAEIPWPHRILHEAADRITELEARCAKYKAAMENALDNARESRTMPPSCANNVINHLEFALTEQVHEYVEDCVRAMRDENASLRAKLADAVAFAKERGHAEDCAVTQCCKACGMSKLWSSHLAVFDDYPAYHEFQPGPCSCGHDRVVGHD